MHGALSALPGDCCVELNKLSACVARVAWRTFRFVRWVAFNALCSSCCV